MTQRIIMIGLSGKVKWIPTLDYTGQLAKAASVGIRDAGLGLLMLVAREYARVNEAVFLRVCMCMFALANVSMIHALANV